MNVKSINPHEAKESLNNQEAIIVDVREPAEYAESHIANSILIPLGTLTLSKLPDLQDKKLIIHCKMGKRGGIACEKLLAEKPDLEVYNLEGGMQAWMDAGFPVKKS